MTPKHVRHGTTLLEVMFAIGVAGIGILGVALLLPLAGHQAARGTQYDRASAYGKASYRALEIAGGFNQRQWVSGQGGVIDIDGDGFWDGILPGQYTSAVCIDPLFVGQHPTVNRFPIPAGTAPPMPRITLRQFYGDDRPGRPKAPPMPLLQAETLCRMGDELNFRELDSRKEFPPDQQYTSVSGSKVKRQYEGEYTWMATLVPGIDRQFTKGPDFAPGDIGVDDDGDGNADIWNGSFDYKEYGFGDDRPRPQQNYVLSLVIFHKRNLTNKSISGILDGERLAYVNTFYSSGIRGGDMLVTGSTKEDVTLRENEWVMLSGEVPAIGKPQPNLPYINPRPVKLYKWYKVITAEEPQLTGATWSALAALDGPDWPTNLVPDAQMTIMSGALEVYSKTVRIEQHDLWKPAPPVRPWTPTTSQIN